MYSKEVIEYFKNPINIGVIKNADGIGVTENDICSDIIKIYISINKDNIITDAKFEVKGCPPVIASCCVLTDMIKNMDIEKAKNITAKEIIEKLNGLPKEKEHCAELVEITLKKAIINFTGSGEIKLDNIYTWGNALKKLLLELSETETLFEEKWICKTIYEKLKKDSSYKDETKIYNQQKSNILKRIQENINSRKIICYHCTRLTKYDYDSIKKSGLIVCSKEKQIKRIKK